RRRSWRPSSTPPSAGAWGSIGCCGRRCRSRECLPARRSSSRRVCTCCTASARGHRSKPSIRKRDSAPFGFGERPASFVGGGFGGGGEVLGLLRSRSGFDGAAIGVGGVYFGAVGGGAAVAGLALGAGELGGETVAVGAALAFEAVEVGALAAGGGRALGVVEAVDGGERLWRWLRASFATGGRWPRHWGVASPACRVASGTRRRGGRGCAPWTVRRCSAR